MVAHRATAVVEDPRYREHRSPAGHPECPERLAAVHEAVAPRANRLEALEPRAAGADEVLRVHSKAHWERVEEAARRAPLQLDPDTFVSPRSFEVARLAAGGSLELAGRIARGELRNGFAAVRPPGHHAEAGRAMGFCLFNNAAVVARALQAEHGLERILILDWDVHHGNGTQHIFEEDPSVLYFSTHQFPFYPGTGDFGERGRGRGEGATVNVPMPAGCGDVEYVGVMQRVLAPVARRFAPDLLLVSSGFDAHRDDPLGGMTLSGDGFASLARIARALAEELCGGRLVCLLEGGYAASGLREGSEALLEALLDPAPPALPEAAPVAPGSPLAAILERVSAAQGRHHPDIGRS
jgi:acetoin utilization deacetylase AcuC-like enzyme